MRMTSAVRVGARDERVLLEPVLVGKPAHLRGEERQDGLHREEQNACPPGCDTARLRHLEAVADLEAADGASLDPLDRHAQVVEPHLGHAVTIDRSLGSATDDRAASARSE